MRIDFIKQNWQDCYSGIYVPNLFKSLIYKVKIKIFVISQN